MSHAIDLIDVYKVSTENSFSRNGGLKRSFLRGQKLFKGKKIVLKTAPVITGYGNFAMSWLSSSYMFENTGKFILRSFQ